jgi:hypothetical protein
MVNYLTEDFKDFAEYIWKNYRKKRIVEVGIGPNDQVFRELRNKGMDVISTDVKSRPDVIVDDAYRPNYEIYESAALIYSIRPPPEMFSYLKKIAHRVGADLIIKPLSTDPSCGGILVSYKKTTFYLFQKKFYTLE